MNRRQIYGVIATFERRLYYQRKEVYQAVRNMSAPGFGRRYYQRMSRNVAATQRTLGYYYRMLGR